MEVKTAIKADYKIIYNGKDITADISPWLIDATYTDKLTGEADELDITISNLDGRWMDAWYPDPGAEIKFEYGYAGEPLTPAGAFTFDELELSDSPATVRIRALAAGVSTPAKTRKGKAYEDTTLKDIVAQVARRLKAEVKGSISHVPILKATQYGESDWAFLIRICHEHGYEVKLTNNSKTLVVEKVKVLAQKNAVHRFTRSDVESWRYRDKITDVPAKTSVRSYNPRQKKLVSAEAKSSNQAGTHSADTHKKHVPARTPAQAQAIANAAQDRHEADKTTIELTVFGSKHLVAGLTITLTEDWKRLAGNYLVTEVRHTISQSQGYKTTPTGKRV